MAFSSSITTGAILWIGSMLALVLLQRLRQHPSTGLSLLYLTSLAIIHLPGALVHNLPWYSFRDLLPVEMGFEQTVYAALAFVAGCSVIIWFTPSNVGNPQRTSSKFYQTIVTPTNMSKSQTANPFFHRLAIMSFVIGQLVFFGLNPLFGRVPTLNALLSITQQLSIVGVSLGLWYALQAQNRRMIITWALLAIAFPLQTIIFQGFIGFGINALLAVILFVLPQLRLRLIFIPLTFLAVYLGLSVYITYFRDRIDIRASVWGEQEVQVRFDVLTTTFSNFELFDSTNTDHLLMIDQRLNQNQLVGLAIFNLSNGYVPYAQGETLWQAGAAIIPRVLWPDKPVVGGSGEIVSSYTGLTFAEGTSVGVGQVMEFYLNFSTLGVIVGFGALGMLISWLDRQAGMALREGRWDSLIHWYLPGLSMIQPGGMLTEVVASFAAALIVSQLFTRFAHRILTAPAPTSSSLPARPISRLRP